MITGLKIFNFQSHKNTSLEFHPGVNVIIGSSDSGKTSLLRSIRKVVWNRPNGDDFRSDWGGDTRIELITPEHNIIRGIDKENWYELDGKKLVAFGTKVPEEIQKALNIDDTNLQKQFDSPFLLSSSPGEVAAYFNQVAHLERIDSSVSYVNGKILSMIAKQKADKASLEEFETEHTQYAYLDKFEIDLEELEHQQSSQTQHIVSRRRLNEHLILLSDNSERIKKQEQIIALEEPVNRLLVMYGERRDMREDLTKFRRTVGTINEIDVLSKSLSKKIELKAQVEELLKLHEEREILCKNESDFRLSIREINYTKQRQVKWETTLEARENLFHKQMPAVCPLCGNETNN